MTLPFIVLELVRGALRCARRDQGATPVRDSKSSCGPSRLRPRLIMRIVAASFIAI